MSRGNGGEYDEMGRRKNVVNSGSAFTGQGFNIYGYNSRSEVISSERYAGTNLADTGSPVEPDNRSYDYDFIGNRKSASNWDYLTASPQTTTYTVNNLNQYEADAYSTGGGNTFTYDLDGNR